MACLRGGLVSATARERFPRVGGVGAAALCAKEALSADLLFSGPSASPDELKTAEAS